MKKNDFILNYGTCVIKILSAFVFLFITIPVSVIQVLICLVFFTVLIIFILSLKLKTGHTAFLHEFIKMICYINCGLGIATLRSFLYVTDFNNNILIIRMIGQWICRNNYICGCASVVLTLMALILFCKRHVVRTTEKSSRLHLGQIYDEYRKIDRDLSNGLITEYDAVLRRRILEDKAGYLNMIDRLSKILFDSFIFLSFLFVFSVAAGTLTGVFVKGLSWADSLCLYVTLSCGYISVFEVINFLLCFSVRIEECNN